MNRLAALPALLPALLWAASPLAAQTRLPDDLALQAPWAAWDAGDYPTALRGYLALLDGPRAAEIKDRIALLTGETHPVAEVAPNGGRLAVAPAGRWATFQVTENGAVVTKLMSLPDGRIAGSLAAQTTALMAGGRIAYLVRRTTPAGEVARRAVDAAPDANARRAAQQTLELIEARAAEVRVRTLPEGRETTLATAGWGPLSVTAAGDALLVVGVPPADGPFDALVLENGEARALGTGGVTGLRAVPGGRWVIGVGGGARRDELLLIDRQGGGVRRFPGRRSPAVAADGSLIAMLGTDAGQGTLEVVRPGDPAAPRVLVRTALPMESPAVSPSGAWVAYQKQPIHDWELFAASVTSGEERQLSFEIQHDLLPVFLDDETVLAMKGEARHRRSYLYKVAGGEPEKLFHNNSVRTIAPEYEWVPTPGGASVLIVADRDGDTISPERAVYLVDLTRGVTVDDVRRRLQEGLGREEDLRARGARSFQPVADAVRQVVGEVSIGRIDASAQDLFRFGSRHITQPGNALTIEYLAARLREFGYDPEVQWFETRAGVRTANVIARLQGTVNPDVVYVSSAHLDSVERGPGSDDDGSGVTALLEAARVLKNHPQPASIEFAFYTAEEAGLLGSIEYSRRVLAAGKRIAGVINNDMIGYTNDHRLDMTIRWSNPGVRDLMHAAATYFTDMITYDARYYRSTDAASLNDAFGDIVGGMGAYPILGNPHYHQATDRVDTVNQMLVAEACKTTIASLMLMASSPAPVKEAIVRPAREGGLDLGWAAAPERGVRRYQVRYTDRAGALRELTVPSTLTRLADVRPGSPISVKAVMENGLESWDWATVMAPL